MLSSVRPAPPALPLDLEELYAVHIGIPMEPGSVCAGPPSHVPILATVSYTSIRPQNEIGS